MGIKPLEEKAKDIAVSEGLIETWLKAGKAPVAVLDSLKTLADGVAYWKQKFYQAQEDCQQTTSNYTNLTVVHGQALQQMQSLKDQVDELLLDSQREFHNRERI